MKKFISFASQYIYPRRCMVCGGDMEFMPLSRVKKGEMFFDVCGVCRKKLEYVKEPFCLRCGRSLEETESEYCAGCAKNNHHYDRGVAAFNYGENIRIPIYSFKYEGMAGYSEFFARELVEKYAKTLELWKPEVIIPVPIHESRRRIRGYNQAEELAYEISKRSGIPVDEHLLMRRKKTKPQKELDEKSRRKNIENAFKLATNVVRYKKVLIVDDIYTTGSTVDECASALKGAGVEKVYFMSICIGYGI